MFELIAYALLFLFLWVTSFLLHELFHILGMKQLYGTITVDGLTMTASPANLWTGGLGSGLVYALAGGLVWLLGAHVLAWLFFTISVMQLVYGLYEGLLLPVWGDSEEYKLGRYTIYIGLTCLMLLVGVMIL